MLLDIVGSDKSLVSLLADNQVYLLDSVGTRAWVEHEGCKEFVTNLLTAFPGAELVTN